MASQAQNLMWSVVTSLCAIVAPFLLGASAVVIGIGFYRMVQPGPRQNAPGFGVGWDLIVPAWPLYLAALLSALIGLYAYRKTIPRDKP